MISALDMLHGFLREIEALTVLGLCENGTISKFADDGLLDSIKARNISIGSQVPIVLIHDEGNIHAKMSIYP